MDDRSEKGATRTGSMTCPRPTPTSREGSPVEDFLSRNSGGASDNNGNALLASIAAHVQQQPHRQQQYQQDSSVDNASNAYAYGCGAMRYEYGDNNISTIAPRLRPSQLSRASTSFSTSSSEEDNVNATPENGAAYFRFRRSAQQSSSDEHDMCDSDNFRHQRCRNSNNHGICRMNDGAVSIPAAGRALHSPIEVNAETDDDNTENDDTCNNNNYDNNDANDVVNGDDDKYWACEDEKDTFGNGDNGSRGGVKELRNRITVEMGKRHESVPTTVRPTILAESTTAASPMIDSLLEHFDRSEMIADPLGSLGEDIEGTPTRLVNRLSSMHILLDGILQTMHNEVVVIFDSLLNIIGVSPAFENMIGTPVGSLHGVNLNTLTFGGLKSIAEEIAAIQEMELEKDNLTEARGHQQKQGFVDGSPNNTDDGVAGAFVLKPKRVECLTKGGTKLPIEIAITAVMGHHRDERDASSPTTSRKNRPLGLGSTGGGSPGNFDNNASSSPPSPPALPTRRILPFVSITESAACDTDTSGSSIDSDWFGGEQTAAQEITGVAFFVAIVKDLRIEEELRRLREEVRTLRSLSHVACIETDEYMKITRFDTAAERLFGFSSGSVVGKNIKIIMPPQIRLLHTSPDSTPCGSPGLGPCSIGHSKHNTNDNGNSVNNSNKSGDYNNNANNSHVPTNVVRNNINIALARNISGCSIGSGPSAAIRAQNSARSTSSSTIASTAGKGAVYVPSDNHDTLARDYVAKVKAIGEKNVATRMIGRKISVTAVRVVVSERRQMHAEEFPITMEVKIHMSAAGNIAFRAFIKEGDA